MLIEVPKEIRLQRVRDRSFQKFGARMLPGGDLYRQEEDFFALVAARPENTAEDWARSMQYPCLRLDGTRPIAENLKITVSWLHDQDAGA